MPFNQCQGHGGELTVAGVVGIGMRWGPSVLAAGVVLYTLKVHTSPDECSDTVSRRPRHHKKVNTIKGEKKGKKEANLIACSRESNLTIVLTRVMLQMKSDRVGVAVWICITHEHGNTSLELLQLLT